MTAPDETEIVAQLRALRVPPPDTEFEARLWARLELEPTPVRPLRVPRSWSRRRLPWLLAAALVPVGALAATQAWRGANRPSAFEVAAPPVSPAQPGLSAQPKSREPAPLEPKASPVAAPGPEAPAATTAPAWPAQRRPMLRVTPRGPTAEPLLVAPTAEPHVSAPAEAAGAPVRIERIEIGRGSADAPRAPGGSSGSGALRDAASGTSNPGDGARDAAIRRTEREGTRSSGEGSAARGRREHGQQAREQARERVERAARESGGKR